MKIYRSRLGAALAFLYLAAAVYVVQDELRHTGGGWINLRGLGTLLVTFPSQLTLGLLLQAAGVSRVNFAEPGVLDYGQLALHVLATAALVYLLGWAAEWLLRRVF
jgi:hypothetical protein